MKLTHLTILALLGIISSCSQPQKSTVADQQQTDTINKKQDQITASTEMKEKEPEVENLGLPVMPVSAILKDFGSFWEYYSGKVELYEDFTAIDQKGDTITKEQFLNQLNTGRYFPLVLTSKPATLSYKLHKIPASADRNIAAYMEQFSAQELAFLKLEGKKIPKFNFRDVDGKLYTSENTKGKIVLFKCWFIGCVACVKEMPALNELVEKYKDRNDILFISLAMDSKEKLQKFLTTTKFDYATVPDQASYMADKLKVSVYPTHFLIDKEGVLVRVLPNDVQVAESLAKLLP